MLKNPGIPQKDWNLELESCRKIHAWLYSISHPCFSLHVWFILLSVDFLSALKAVWLNTATQSRIWLLRVFLVLSPSWFSSVSTAYVLFLIFTNLSRWLFLLFSFLLKILKIPFLPIYIWFLQSISFNLRGCVSSYFNFFWICPDCQLVTVKKSLRK